MKLPQLAAAVFVLSPSLVSAALFPSDTLVKFIDAKGFKKAMKQNTTSVIAFVAPWCGHCQRMAPEYSKAAVGLSPMVPLYAVDCDNDGNKRLCAEQGVQGFPTIKLFPRGGQSKPVNFDSAQRTATNFFYWASRNIPHGVKRFDKVTDVPRWVDENIVKPRALLLNSGKEIPLLWKALGNKYKDQMAFAILQDKSGKNAVKMGVNSEASKASKILIYPSGSTKFARFEGTQKFETLSKFFGTVLDGTAYLTMVNEDTETRAGFASVHEGDQVVPTSTEVGHEQTSETAGPSSTLTEKFDVTSPPTATPETEQREASVDEDEVLPMETEGGELGVHAGTSAMERGPVLAEPAAEPKEKLGEAEHPESPAHAKDEL